MHLQIYKQDYFELNFTQIPNEIAFRFGNFYGKPSQFYNIQGIPVEVYI